jgi:hypothetical protein
MRRLPARDLARYAQIDYDRDMTFVAVVGQDVTEIAGEVRIFTYPDGETNSPCSCAATCSAAESGVRSC